MGLERMRAGDLLDSCSCSIRRASLDEKLEVGDRIDVCAEIAVHLACFFYSRKGSKAFIQAHFHKSHR